MAREHDALLEAEAKRELARQQRKDEYQFLLKHPLGRAHLARLIFEHGALEVSSFSSNSQEAAFNEGQRAVGIVINREAYLADREGWAVMRNEHTERLRSKELEAVNRIAE